MKTQSDAQHGALDVAFEQAHSAFFRPSFLFEFKVGLSIPLSIPLPWPFLMPMNVVVILLVWGRGRGTIFRPFLLFEFKVCVCLRPSDSGCVFLYDDPVFLSPVQP